MVYYHNITKQKFNLCDEEELMEFLDEGDILMYTESGNGIVHPVDQASINRLAKIKQDFIEAMEDDYHQTDDNG
jgi:hypothetical protein